MVISIEPSTKLPSVIIAASFDFIVPSPEILGVEGDIFGIKEPTLLTEMLLTGSKSFIVNVPEVALDFNV